MSGKIVSEMIGRTAPVWARTAVMQSVPSVDATRPDYGFWSRLRRGKEPGYELGALFAKRIAEIDAEWTLGRGFRGDTDDVATDALIDMFVQEHLDTLMTWRKDANALGDAYVVVNPDASVHLASPETVEVISQKANTAEVIGYRIVTIEEGLTITDEYYADHRILKVRGSGGEVVTPFENPLGVIPVVHLANDRESNELYGHPIYEALLKLFARYDDVLQKSLDGVEVMGRPIPVAEGLEDPAEAQRLNASYTETVTLGDGSTADVPVVDFEDLSMLWLGKGASFKFAAPGSFSADSVAMLKKLFYLMLEHSGIPEWTWGGAVASSKASVEAQLPAFIRYLEGRRVASHKAVLQVVRVWLGVKALMGDASVNGWQMARIIWPELEAKDEALRLQKIDSATKGGLLSKATHLHLLDLVENPDEEVLAADSEASAQAQASQDRFDQAFAALANGEVTDDNTDEDQISNDWQQ